MTNSDHRVFSVYLGNIPADVLLEEIWINGKQLTMSESAEQSYSISPVVHTNGSRAFELQLPFENGVVHWMVSAPQNLHHLLSACWLQDALPQHSFSVRSEAKL